LVIIQSADNGYGNVDGIILYL